MAIEHGGNAFNVPLNYNIFLHGTSECAAVPGVVSLSHMLPETHHTPKKQNMHEQSHQFFTTCGVLQVTGHQLSYLINTCRAQSG